MCVSGTIYYKNHENTHTHATYTLPHRETRTRTDTYTQSRTKLQIGKGRVEPGEDVQETAVREGEEELGLKRTNFAGPIVMVGQSLITGQEETYTFYCYAVQVKNVKNFNQPHYETGWSGWVPSEEALSKIKNAQKSLLLATINKIKQLHPEE